MAYLIKLTVILPENNPRTIGIVASELAQDLEDIRDEYRNHLNLAGFAWEFDKATERMKEAFYAEEA